MSTEEHKQSPTRSSSAARDQPTVSPTTCRLTVYFLDNPFLFHADPLFSWVLACTPETVRREQVSLAHPNFTAPSVYLFSLSLVRLE